MSFHGIPLPSLCQSLSTAGQLLETVSLARVATLFPPRSKGKEKMAFREFSLRCSVPARMSNTLEMRVLVLPLDLKAVLLLLHEEDFV